MLYTFGKIWRPWIFQGHTRRDHYFEGWYYKLVDAGGSNILALIPGIAKNKAAGDSHAFIQVFDGLRNTAHYHRFSLEDFQASKKELSFSIGPNEFRYNRIKLQLNTPEQILTGELHFSPPIPWPIKAFSPGFMGWYAFVPFMQCYHGVLNFDYSIRGSLQHNDHSICFDDGRGYLEKDWGTSFPGSWIWMQSNHFADPGISWMCSIATIPWLGGQFTGFGAGLMLNGDFYPFTTWNGAKIEDLSSSASRVTFTLVHKSYKIEVDATGESGAKLRSPVLGKMAETVLESLQARIDLRLSLREKGGWREIFVGTGLNSGIEISLLQNGVHNSGSLLPLQE